MGNEHFLADYVRYQNQMLQNAPNANVAQTLWKLQNHQLQEKWTKSSDLAKLEEEVQYLRDQLQYEKMNHEETLLELKRVQKDLRDWQDPNRVTVSHEWWRGVKRRMEKLGWLWHML